MSTKSILHLIPPTHTSVYAGTLPPSAWEAGWNTVLVTPILNIREPISPSKRSLLFLEWILRTDPPSPSYPSAPENKELVYDHLLLNDTMLMAGRVQELEASRPRGVHALDPIMEEEEEES